MGEDRHVAALIKRPADGEVGPPSDVSGRFAAGHLRDPPQMVAGRHTAWPGG
jgi:hypothetical protein